MTARDLLGKGGETIILEDVAIQEFAEVMEAAGEPSDVPSRHIRQAKNVIGAPIGAEYLSETSELIGQFWGRRWYAEYGVGATRQE